MHTIHLDFETYSEAGYRWVDGAPKALIKGKPGLKGVGTAAYAAHPSTEIISLCWDGVLWIPGQDEPSQLFEHVSSGGLVCAHHSMFEFLIWHYVGNLRLGWPALPLSQMRCSMATATAFSLPGALAGASKVMGLQGKLDSGKKLIQKFSNPRKPTKKDLRTRIPLSSAPAEAIEFYQYNIQDVVAEAELSEATPPLSPYELAVWQLDQRINARGVAIDKESVNACMVVVEDFTKELTDELRHITGGSVQTHSEVAKILAYVTDHGTSGITNVTKHSVAWALERETDPACVRVLEIRMLLGLSSIAKLNSIDARLSPDGRLRCLFKYYGGHTGRWAGSGPQPQNLPSSGPFSPWGEREIEQALEIIRCGTMAEISAYCGGRVLDLVSGCLRGLFVAADGCDLISSDFSAIEAVVLAELAEESWRQEVFRTHGKIYEMSAAKASGIPFEDILRHKEETGEHHPMRKKLGKVRELASGYGGWVAAWIAFGADKFLSEDEISAGILRWREESPAIVEFWGGQERKHPTKWEFTTEYYGAEGMFIRAILDPGTTFWHKRISFTMEGPRVRVGLPSGRFLTYHNVRLEPGQSRYSKRDCYKISYEGWNSDSSKGSVGWMRRYTYGGKLVENITQAVARDIHAHSLLQLEAAGYNIVLHVHDESVSEVISGTGSVKHYEKTMCITPEWCRDWPIRAAGGWRGKRYRK